MTTPSDGTTEGGEEFAAYADEARDWANVTLPTALEGWPEFTTAPTRCDGSKRCGYHHAVVGVFRCCCGRPWVNKSCASGAKAGEPAPDGSIAPVTAEDGPTVPPKDSQRAVTAEDLRERYAKAATEWALMYPLANWPWPGRTLAGADAERLDAIARDIAAAWGRDIADRMLAEISPVLERYREAVEDAPGGAIWTGTCVECGNPIDPGDAITWRLRWSPQGPIHEECR